MENLLISLRCVLPIFLIICTGAIARRRNFVPEETFSNLSIFSFHTLIPCMLFYNIYASDLSLSFDPAMLLFLVGSLLLWFCLGMVVFHRFEPDPRTRGAYLQCFFRTNIAVFSVVLAENLLDPAGVASMAMAVAIITPLFNVLSVIALESCRGGTIHIPTILKGILKNPLIPPCLLGIAFLVLRIRLPAPVEQALSTLGGAGSALTLIALGASFQTDGLRKNWKKVLFCDFIRLILSPFAAVSCALLLGFRGNALGVILLATAAPMATNTYPMAIACDSDHELTGQAVVTTAFLACFTLFLWIFLLKQFAFL